ncbi:hypothetical protein T492DRAFT_847571 [Pavlovales sp. CCMP2436]|nr:hypothetical protein T492DRAFT_847571 [Pavlovales sp. CCMP2436]
MYKSVLAGCFCRAPAASAERALASASAGIVSCGAGGSAGLALTAAAGLDARSPPADGGAMAGNSVRLASAGLVALACTETCIILIPYACNAILARAGLVVWRNLKPVTDTCEPHFNLLHMLSEAHMFTN